MFSVTEDQPQPCEDPDDEVAAAVDAVLVHGATVEIDGDDMTMWADDVGLGLRAAEER
ncbi:MAG: hypothetical protein JJU45_02795 [Acidimicrobiia bacterium]|nr:hypothetical protein [Acidimicrobiia bacterium]